MCVYFNCSSTNCQSLNNLPSAQEEIHLGGVTAVLINWKQQPEKKTKKEQKKNNNKKKKEQKKNKKREAFCSPSPYLFYIFSLKLDWEFIQVFLLIPPILFWWRKGWRMKYCLAMVK